MRLCGYLFLQHRIKEAKTFYIIIIKNYVIGNELTSFGFQYDYLTTYLDFSI